jgi:hypothetical protein
MNLLDVVRALPIQVRKDELLESAGLQVRPSAAHFYAARAGAFTFGVAVGAALALLYAPKSGRDLRRELGARIDEMRTTHHGESVRPEEAH